MPADSTRTAHRRPLWLGLVFAPFAAPLVLALLSGVGDSIGGGTRGVTTAIEVFAFALALGLPLAYLGLLGLGLPIVLHLRARGRLSTARLLLYSLPVGSIALVVGFWLAGFKLGLLAQIGIGAVMGLSVTAAFCLLCGIPWRARGTAAAAVA